MGLLEESGAPLVDVFRTVVGMEAEDDEGEGLYQVLGRWQQEALGDALDRAGEPELGDLVDEIDLVEALDAVKIPLMDRIDTQEADGRLDAVCAARRS